MQSSPDMGFLQPDVGVGDARRKENTGIASKTALGIKEEMKTQKIKSTEVGET